MACGPETFLRGLVAGAVVAGAVAAAGAILAVVFLPAQPLAQPVQPDQAETRPAQAKTRTHNRRLSEEEARRMSPQIVKGNNADGASPPPGPVPLPDSGRASGPGGGLADSRGGHA